MILSDAGNQNALPPPPSGWFDFRYSVLQDGSLAVLRVDFDVYGREGGSSMSSDFGMLLDQGRILARIDILGGNADAGVVDFPLEAAYPLFDRLPNGE
jgi:hypothetical protein